MNEETGDSTEEEVEDMDRNLRPMLTVAQQRIAQRLAVAAASAEPTLTVTDRAHVPNDLAGDDVCVKQYFFAVVREAVRHTRGMPPTEAELERLWELAQARVHSEEQHWGPLIVSRPWGLGLQSHISV